VHEGVCADPRATLDRLFACYVDDAGDAGDAGGVP
jgi:hypothetical protein